MKKIKRGKPDLQNGGTKVSLYNSATQEYDVAVDNVDIINAIFEICTSFNVISSTSAFGFVFKVQLPHHSTNHNPKLLLRDHIFNEDNTKRLQHETV